MAYFQIASTTFSRPREDGSTRTYALVLEKLDFVPQDWDIPVVSDIIIETGSDKPVYTFIAETIVSFKIKARTTHPLIPAFENLQYRELRLTILETTNGVELFKGYVSSQYSPLTMYAKTQEMTVRASGQLRDIEISDSPIGQLSLSDLSAQIGSSIGIIRPMQLYSDLHPLDADLSAYPNNLRFDSATAGGGQDSTLLDITRSVMHSLGYRIMQNDGNLAFVDLYEQVFERSALKLYQEASGTFTASNVDVRKAIDATNTIRFPQKKSVTPVRTMVLQQELNDATFFAFGALTSETVALNETATFTPTTFVLPGNVYSLSTAGKVETVTNSTITGELHLLQVRITDISTGQIYYYNFSGAWVTTEQHLTESISLDVNNQSQAYGTSNAFALPAIPDDVIGPLEIILEAEPTSASQSNIQDIKHNKAVDIDIFLTEDNAGQPPIVYNQHVAQSVEQPGDQQELDTFIGDVNVFTAEQSFSYITTIGSLAQSREWVDPAGNATLHAVVSRRLATVYARLAQQVTFSIRDIMPISLLNTFEVNDNDGSTLVCLPHKIRHQLLAGYYTVQCRSVSTPAITQTQQFRLEKFDE